MDIVILEPNHLNAIPFTTSKIVAEGAEVDHHTVTRLIRNYENDLKEFGILGFQIQEIIGRGQPEKIYHLNEEQTTLLFTYMRNTPVVRKFKKALVRAFYNMARELISRKVSREIGIAARRSLTDTIKDCTPDSPNKKFYYKHYTDLVYKKVLGMNSKKYQEKYEIPDGHLKDYLTDIQLKKIATAEELVKALIAHGSEYDEIKNILNRPVLVKKDKMYKDANLFA